jgi:hypothetical protein
VHKSQHFQQILHKRTDGNFLLPALALKRFMGQAEAKRDSVLPAVECATKSSRTTR